jgi:hypothetical protein
MLRNMVDVAIDVFGGYCPAIVPANLPPGAANIAQDVMFPQAGVRTRGGLGAGVAFGGAEIPAGASINGMKTFLTSTGGRDLMIWDSLGDMFVENPQGTLNLINSRPYQNLFYESQTLFSREYQAFFNSLGGFDIPRQYDGTNWDRVSQVGPGISPTASDNCFALLSISRAADTGVITVGLDAPSTAGFAKGGSATISGVTADASLNGSFPIYAATYSGGTWALLLWGTAGAYAISAISRESGTVTATLEETAVIPSGSTPLIIGGVEDSSYDGEFTPGSVSGNQVTWAQTGANSVSAGGFLYVENFAASVQGCFTEGYLQVPPNGLGAVNVYGNQVDAFPANSTVSITGSSVSGWNTTFPVSPTTPAVFLPFGTPITPGGSTPLIVDGQVLAPAAQTVTEVDGITVVYLSGTVPSTPGYGGLVTASLPASSPPVSGVIGIAGNISQGLHNVSVAFITRQGSILNAAPWTSWNAQGGFTAALSSIPTGPPNIAQRLLLFTPAISPPATTGTFYSLPTGSTALSSLSVMLISDNVTTSTIVDFSDAILISGFQAEYLFSELELGECAFMLPYNSRTVWLGERARVPNFVNLSFDGGFHGTIPNGWTFTPTYEVGGGSAVAEGLPVDWGDAYVITGSGASLSGGIQQSAYRDNLQVTIIQPLTSYSVRVRLAIAGTPPTQGTLNINLQSTLGAFTTPGLQVNATALSAEFQEFTANLTAAPLANPPTDLVMQLYTSGALTNGSQIIIDSIEVFPTLTPFNTSIARLSRAFNPESFDSITGQVQIRSGDGQQLRAGFPLRNSLYLAKDHYLGYVTDDGVNEPSSWQFTEVSATVGICGPNAVDWNEEWAVFAERSGFYICWGSDPVKITPEIQIDATNTGRVCWNSINWTAAYTIWVRIDKVNKMILIGAPINGATSPNVVFMMDYQWLESAEDIASSPLVGYSSFTGKMLAHGRGRRWAIWNITANSMCFAEREDGSAQPFFGGVGNGTVFWQRDISINGSDNGAIVNSQYQSYATPSAVEEQQYQLRAHRKLLGYLKWRAWGSGTLNIAISTALRSTLLRGYPLSTNPTGDGERPVNVHGERFFITVYTNAVNSYFQLEKLIPCMKKDSSALVRGVNS